MFVLPAVRHYGLRKPTKGRAVSMATYMEEVLSLCMSVSRSHTHTHTKQSAIAMAPTGPVFACVSLLSLFASRTLCAVTPITRKWGPPPTISIVDELPCQENQDHPGAGPEHCLDQDQLAFREHDDLGPEATGLPWGCLGMDFTTETSLTWGSTVTRTCNGAQNPQACLHYSSVHDRLGTTADVLKCPWPIPSGDAPRPEVKVYNDQHNEGWISYIETWGVNAAGKPRACQRDEYPPALFMQGQNGVDGTSTPVYIRLLPDQQNQRGGRL